jgi:hypothetical protein
VEVEMSARVVTSFGATVLADDDPDLRRNRMSNMIARQPIAASNSGDGLGARDVGSFPIDDVFLIRLHR